MVSDLSKAFEQQIQDKQNKFKILDNNEVFKFEKIYFD